MPNGISKQNKDILHKILAENFKGMSLNSLGLKLPQIKRMLPTNLPAMQLDEKRADNVFLLEDNTILLLEYESKSSSKNLLKYCHYAFRIMEKYYSEKYKKIIVVVIYTSDVKTASNNLDIGSMQLKIEQIFLSKFNGHDLYKELVYKVENDIPLSSEDMMRFIVLPLTEKNKANMVEKAVNLAKKIKDRDKQIFIIAGLISATDKFIDKKYLELIKEWLKMTQLARLYEEEKQNAVKEAEIKAKKQNSIEIAKKMLQAGEPIEKISIYSGLTEDEIKAL